MVVPSDLKHDLVFILLHKGQKLLLIHVLFPIGEFTLPVVSSLVDVHLDYKFLLIGGLR